MYSSVLNDLYNKNNDVYAHNTRTKDMFCISLGTQTFSSVSVKIWNALFSKFVLNVPLYKFKMVWYGMVIVYLTKSKAR